MNFHKSQLFWCELQGYKVLTHCHLQLSFELLGGFNQWPFIDDFPIKTSIYQGCSMAMLNRQMVYIYSIYSIYNTHISPKLSTSPVLTPPRKRRPLEAPDTNTGTWASLRKPPEGVFPPQRATGYRIYWMVLWYLCGWIGLRFMDIFICDFWYF